MQRGVCPEPHCGSDPSLMSEGPVGVMLPQIDRGGGLYGEKADMPERGAVSAPPYLSPETKQASTSCEVWSEGQHSRQPVTIPSWAGDWRMGLADEL